MKTLARFFLAASVISLAISFTPPGGDFLWGALKPMSALLFGAFFITNVLAREYAQYDEEHEYRIGLARKQKSKPAIERDDAPATTAAESLEASERKPVQGEASAAPEEREAVSLRDH